MLVEVSKIDLFCDLLLLMTFKKIKKKTNKQTNTTKLLHRLQVARKPYKQVLAYLDYVVTTSGTLNLQHVSGKGIERNRAILAKVAKHSSNLLNGGSELVEKG